MHHKAPEEKVHVFKMSEFIEAYRELEGEIGKRIYAVSHQFCQKCSQRCCKEVMCRESLESSFLRSLGSAQQETYDEQHGWLGNDGCRLKYGRPLVCHEFFCDEILNSSSDEMSAVRQLVAEFVAIGKRAHRGAHLICIESLEKIPATKIEKMICSITQLMNRLRNQ